MSLNQSQHDESNTSADAAPATLPKGYLWRLAVLLFLMIGGAISLLFFNGVLGALMALGGIAFAKLSGLDEMVKAGQS